MMLQWIPSTSILGFLTSFAVRPRWWQDLAMALTGGKEKVLGIYTTLWHVEGHGRIFYVCTL